jgi:hypothetical protein
MSEHMKPDEVKNVMCRIVKSKSGGGDPYKLAVDAVVDNELKAKFPTPKAKDAKKKTDEEKKEEKDVKKQREDARDGIHARIIKKYPDMDAIRKLDGDVKKAIEKASLDNALKSASIALINEVICELTGKTATATVIAGLAGGKKATHETLLAVLVDILDNKCRPFDALVESMKSPDKSSSGGKKVQKGELKDEDGEKVEPILDTDGKPLVWAKWTKTVDDATKVLVMMRLGKKMTDEQTRAQLIGRANILLDAEVKKTKSSGGKPAQSKVVLDSDDEDEAAPASPKSEPAKPASSKHEPTLNASDDEDETLEEASDDE